MDARRRARTDHAELLAGTRETPKRFVALLRRQLLGERWVIDEAQHGPEHGDAHGADRATPGDQTARARVPAGAIQESKCVARRHREHRQHHESGDDQETVQRERAKELASRHETLERGDVLAQDIESEKAERRRLDDEQPEQQIAVPEIAQRLEPRDEAVASECGCVLVVALLGSEKQHAGGSERARREQARADAAKAFGKFQRHRGRIPTRALREIPEIRQQEERERCRRTCRTCARPEHRGRSRAARGRPTMASAATAPNGRTPANGARPPQAVTPTAATITTVARRPTRALGSVGASRSQRKARESGRYQGAPRETSRARAAERRRRRSARWSGASSRSRATRSSARVRRARDGARRGRARWRRLPTARTAAASPAESARS